MIPFYTSRPKLVELSADVREGIIRKIKYLLSLLCCATDLDEIENEVDRRRELVSLVKPEGYTS